VVIKFRDRVPTSVRDDMKRQLNGKIGGVELRSVRWLGNDGLEHSDTNMVSRLVFTDRHLVVAGIGRPSGGRAKPEEVAGFFDNFEITK
jgi:hypothetical protein